MYLSNTPSCGRRGQVREQGATVQCRLRAEIPFKSLTNICSTLGETTTFATFATVTTLSNFKASKPNLFRVFLIVVPFQQRKKKKKKKRERTLKKISQSSVGETRSLTSIISGNAKLEMEMEMEGSERAYSERVTEEDAKIWRDDAFLDVALVLW